MPDPMCMGIVWDWGTEGGGEIYMEREAHMTVPSLFP